MKKIIKIIFAIVLIDISLTGKAYANEDDDILKADLKKAVKDTIDGKLYYQVNIRTVFGPSDINIFRSNTDEDYLPSASTIKPFIGLTILDKVEKGEMVYTEEIKKDLDLSLRLSDNDATNRLIEVLGGFDDVNNYIKSFTNKDRTRLNRLMLTDGEENIANAKDLASSFYEIYKSDSEIARDMTKSLANSSSKRRKLLKNVNRQYKTMNKTGELNRIENDLAFVDTGSQAYIVSVMTENNRYMDTYNQILLINKLGEDIAKAYEKYELSYKNKEKAREEKIANRLTTTEKKLAYAVYTNEIFIKAGNILLASDLKAVDDMRYDLMMKIDDSKKVIEKSKNALAKLSKEDIKDEEDMIVNLVRLIYTNKKVNSDINKDLAIAFYNNKAAVKAGQILLNEAPKTSLNIRRNLLKNIKNSEKVFDKMDRFFDKMNAEN